MWVFEPTAKLTDFESVPGLKDSWGLFINDLYETHLYGKPNDRVRSALEELQTWGRSDSDLRVYNPASMPILSPSEIKNVIWSALPTSFDEQFNNTKEKYSYLDERQEFPGDPSTITRIQDEYCEWIVKRNADNKIIEVIFTSEPPEYYNFMFYTSQESRDLLVDVYRKITGIQSITIDDLVDSRGEYDWYNRYNNEFAVHMQQPNNTLGAQVNIVSRSCILRINGLGNPITDAQGLIRCGRYGDEARQSDPRIGDAINKFSRENRFITIENPVGLYMSDVDWNGWETPDGTLADTFWTVLRGSQDADPNKSYIVRAVYSVPESKNYTVSDIKIGGEQIDFGAQIAGRINVRVGVLVSEPQQIPLPRAIGCTGTSPFPLPTLVAVTPSSAVTAFSGMPSRMNTNRTRGEM
ncbi:hypothetical protein FJR11_22175 [Anabaena sp. UHCC 0187]|uniref:hypothetical protein n=1 Tax=Anabaena sp. UHCC 0187 TaxID=2590018 RepID=UPI0014469F66|nr:hypothetical protein [Anabaena sp. UHCC 0187]MTJ15219.1 hypothetical protein [Anabaena sp. UHCC 0187]